MGERRERASASASGRRDYQVAEVTRASEERIKCITIGSINLLSLHPGHRTWSIFAAQFGSSRPTFPPPPSMRR